jgi:hypothetical protein
MHDDRKITNSAQEVVAQKLYKFAKNKEDLGYIAQTLSDVESLKTKYLNKDHQNVHDMVYHHIPLF